MWSTQLRYVATVVTDCDLMLRIWSPGLQESGGHVTDLDGKELDFTAGRRLKANRGMIVARPGMQLLFLMS